ncbi:MAG: DUF3145 domain-containing protein [Candidatus Nanopelagicales bacterium]|jgi:hypothetical protein
MTVVVNARGASDAGPSMGPARGVIFIHSCPRAVSPHVDWALASVFGSRVEIDWAAQPVEPTAVRAELVWGGPVGTGAKIASALQAFRQLRHEVTEDPSPGREGERFSFTPSLGLYRATIGPHGDVMVPEDRLRTALTQVATTGESLAGEISRLIGAPWDEELEPFRCAHEGSTVRVLHHVV